jgi:hypothetical protein
LGPVLPLLPISFVTCHSLAQVADIGSSHRVARESWLRGSGPGPASCQPDTVTHASHHPRINRAQQAMAAAASSSTGIATSGNMASILALPLPTMKQPGWAIDLGDDPNQWPTEPYKFFQQSAEADCEYLSCWHTRMRQFYDGPCQRCHFPGAGKCALHRSAQAAQRGPSRWWAS